ncbi:MAG: DUF1858 domain-containing protein [Firmicutes bacterium]|nr:DUF1858 domain-containing protein [Bacillota bacterium]
MNGEFNEITEDTIIGDLLDKYPQARPVIEKHFGMACFICPGVRFESVSIGCMMHAANPGVVIKEIKEAVSHSGQGTR